MKKLFLIAAFVAAFFSVSAIVLSCSKKSASRDETFAGDWVLAFYEKDGQNILEGSGEERFGQGVVLTATASDDPKAGFRIGGFSGVNNFMGGAKAYKDGSAKIEFNASTMMAGLPEDEEFERAYLENMKSVTNVAFENEGNKMTLSGNGVKIVFEKK